MNPCHHFFADPWKNKEIQIIMISSFNFFFFNDYVKLVHTRQLNYKKRDQKNRRWKVLEKSLLRNKILTFHAQKEVFNTSTRGGRCNHLCFKYKSWKLWISHGRFDQYWENEIDNTDIIWNKKTNTVCIRLIGHTVRLAFLAQSMNWNSLYTDTGSTGTTWCAWTRASASSGGVDPLTTPPYRYT